MYVFRRGSNKGSARVQDHHLIGSQIRDLASVSGDHVVVARIICYAVVVESWTWIVVDPWKSVSS